MLLGAPFPQPEALPFPHLVVDDLMDAGTFDQLGENWPDPRQFTETDGNGREILSLGSPDHWRKLRPRQVDFWRHFAQGIVVPMVREVLPWCGLEGAGDIGVPDEKIILRMLDLMQLSEPSPVVPIHTHYQSPLLCGTCIIYVDDNGHTERGTRLFAPSDRVLGEDELFALTNRNQATAELYDKLDCARDIAFKPNRALICVDGPTSWHDVARHEGLEGPRRQIICNWSLPDERIEPRYGVDIGTFLATHFHTRDPALLNPWIAQDIARQNAIPPISDALRARAAKIPVAGHQALDFI
jgi:hypothetical protein